MSLAVVIKGTEGVVLAADSRVTLDAQLGGGPVISVNFDNATKLLKFTKPDTNVGVVTYGSAVIGQRTASSFVPEFETWLANEINSGEQRKDQLPIEKFAEKLSAFYQARWDAIIPSDYSGPGMIFIVGGYDPGASYGSVFLFDIPNNPVPQARNPGEDEFGMTWGGQLQIASRIIHGYDPNILGVLQQKFDLDSQGIKELADELRQAVEFPIPYMVLPLQDCVNLARYLISATMTAQNLAIGIRGVGGPIDVAVVYRTTGLTYVQEKKLS